MGDTAEVSAAKAAHLATKSTIAVSPISVIAKPAYYIASRMVSHANGAVVPADEPAVYAAKVKHYKAMAMPMTMPMPMMSSMVAHPNDAVVPAEPANVVNPKRA